MVVGEGGANTQKKLKPRDGAWDKVGDALWDPDWSVDKTNESQERGDIIQGSPFGWVMFKVLGIGVLIISMGICWLKKFPQPSINASQSYLNPHRRHRNTMFWLLTLTAVHCMILACDEVCIFLLGTVTYHYLPSLTCHGDFVTAG